MYTIRENNEDFFELMKRELEKETGTLLKKLSNQMSIFNFHFLSINNKIKIYDSQTTKLKSKFNRILISTNFFENDSSEYYLELDNVGLVEEDGKFYFYELGFIENRVIDRMESLISTVVLKNVTDINIIGDGLYELYDNEILGLCNLKSTLYVDDIKFYFKEKFQKINYIFNQNREKNINTLKYIHLISESKIELFEFLNFGLKKIELPDFINNSYDIIFFSPDLERIILKKNKKISLYNFHGHLFFEADTLIDCRNEFFLCEKAGKILLSDTKNLFLTDEEGKFLKNYYVEDDKKYFDEKLFYLKNSSTKNRIAIEFNDKFTSYEIKRNKFPSLKNIFLFDLGEKIEIVTNYEKRKYTKEEVSIESFKILENKYIKKENINYPVEIISVNFTKKRKTLIQYDGSSSSVGKTNYSLKQFLLVIDDGFIFDINTLNKPLLNKEDIARQCFLTYSNASPEMIRIVLFLLIEKILYDYKKKRKKSLFVLQKKEILLWLDEKRNSQDILKSSPQEKIIEFPIDKSKYNVKELTFDEIEKIQEEKNDYKKINPEDIYFQKLK